MTTLQKYFHNIVHLSAASYEAIDKIVGDLNKNIGLSAELFENASEIIGSTITENYDLASLFGLQRDSVASDNSDVLLQSLQNTITGIATTASQPDFRVSAHFSTTVFDYGTMSTGFLSAQIFRFASTGIGTTSVIQIPATDLSVSGNLYNSHLFDAPLDFAVYGIASFNGTDYTGSDLILFDHAWSHDATDTLLVKLDYPSPASNYYIGCYWGSPGSLSTSAHVSGSLAYVGTDAFISNIGIYTGSPASAAITDFSGRNNFWSNDVPTGLSLIERSFAEADPFLWAQDRINASLIDGVPNSVEAPLRYPVTNEALFSDIVGNEGTYAFVYSRLETSGVKYDPNAMADLKLSRVYSSDTYQYPEKYALNSLYSKEVPVGITVLQKNARKTSLEGGAGYSVVGHEQIVPSAFISVIEDPQLWRYFAGNMVAAKKYYQNLNDIVAQNVDILDNFIVHLFFGDTLLDVSDYFSGDRLWITERTLKTFTQPYGSEQTDPLNFDYFEEKALYEASDIVSSKEYMVFEGGKWEKKTRYNLPANKNFEIFKPVSYVCNGIDPYDQGTGLALDYTLNMKFNYANQNTLSKTLYLMASKYLLSKSDYESRVENNEDVYGYYYLADPYSTDYSPYSVSSLDTFRLYGYAGMIPDLKDGVVRPILTKVFSPEDSEKYTYEQYVQLLISRGITDPDDINDAIQQYLDAGNTFLVVDLNSHSNLFSDLEELSLCATNYALNQAPYWNVPNKQDLIILDTMPADGGAPLGFTELQSRIVSGGIVTSLTAAPPDFVVADVPVGYNCRVTGVTVNSLGAGQNPGSYETWVLPEAAATTDEEPALLSYTIAADGTLNASSISVENRGRFYFDFNADLTDPGFSTTIGTSYANVKVVLDNLALFEATVNGYQLISFEQTQPPAYGYAAGFKLNQRCFVGLGYTSTADVDILIDNYPTIDSFLIAPANLNAGDLEYYGSFDNPQPVLSAMNYTSGTQNLALFDNAVYNSINVPSAYSEQKLTYLGVDCKLIELYAKEPAGYITASLYVGYGTGKVKLAESEQVSVADLNRETYSTVNIPLDYTFGLFYMPNPSYYVSIDNHLENCLLSVKGEFLGVSTSDFHIRATHVLNDPNPALIYGSLGNYDQDIDLGIATVGIGSLFGSSVIGVATNYTTVYLRKNSSLTDTTNRISLKVGTSYLGATGYIFSTPISAASLATTYTGIAFTFLSNLEPSTVVTSAELVFSEAVNKDQLYMARGFSLYDVSQIGFATTCALDVNGTETAFNFVFNKLFGQVDPEIYGAFNYTDDSQFGLAKPNRQREIESLNVVDGYWTYTTKQINQPVSIYPRAFLSNSSAIGTSEPEYAYMGYTHDMYVNVGYNSDTEYSVELITLNSYPKWKATWISRTMSNYKTFDTNDTIQQTYLDSIFYRVGLASTVIGIHTGPKSAIFEGTFQPEGNLAAQVPVTVNLGTSCGVQVYVNNNTQPIIDTYSVVSSGSTSVVGYLTTEVRTSPVQFKILYFTLGTPSIEVYWNMIGVSSLINAQSSATVPLQPVAINSGYPVGEIVFLNVSKTYDEATDVNYGYPPGDSFVIRSS